MAHHKPPPRVLLESPEETAIERLNRQYQEGAWTAVNLQSMPSIPLSDLSHTTYGGGSNYLDSRILSSSTTLPSFQRASQIVTEGNTCAVNNSVNDFHRLLNREIRKCTNTSSHPLESGATGPVSAPVVSPATIIPLPHTVKPSLAAVPRRVNRRPSPAAAVARGASHNVPTTALPTKPPLQLNDVHIHIHNNNNSNTTPNNNIKEEVIYPLPPITPSRRYRQPPVTRARRLSRAQDVNQPLSPAMSDDSDVSLPLGSAATSPAAPTQINSRAPVVPAPSAVSTHRTSPTMMTKHKEEEDGGGADADRSSRLVALVTSISDAEVLHVIHDHLRDNNNKDKAYKGAAAVCADILSESMRKSAAGGFHHDEPGVSPTLVDGSVSQLPHADHHDEMDNYEDGDEDEDDAADEFGELSFQPSPYVLPPSKFSFAEPSVFGTTTRMFNDGMLYRIVDSKGNYHFFNDTLNQVMMVRARCVLNGQENINERAVLHSYTAHNNNNSNNSSEETEITIAVLPEETNFLIGNCGRLRRVLAKAVTTPPDYISPSVTRCYVKMNAGIHAVRTALGKWQKATDQQAYLKCCVQHKIKFTDLEFKPSAEALCRPRVDVVTISPMTWRRPEEYLSLTEVSETRLFRGEISCHLVKQGALNNHTVVAAIAAVAQYPEHVQWMFRHPTSASVGKYERAVGCYRVTMQQNGWWATHMVDDYLPASLRGPLFARCPQDPRRLWVPLLEKAYAKAVGSYAALCLVDALDAMTDFTGFPGRRFDAMWGEAKMTRAATTPTCISTELFSYIQSCTSKGYAVMLFTPLANNTSMDKGNHSTTTTNNKITSTRSTPQLDRFFLPGHIYFVCDCMYYPEMDLRMVRLRNPWTWASEQSDHSPSPPATAQQQHSEWCDKPDLNLSGTLSFLSGSAVLPTNVTNTNTNNTTGGPADVADPRKKEEMAGTMWLKWSDALQAFGGGGVCYTSWRHHRYQVKNCFINGHPRFALEVKPLAEVTELVITLTMAGLTEGLDGEGNVTHQRRGGEVLSGVTCLLTRHEQQNTEAVVQYATDDIECPMKTRCFTQARTVSMTATLRRADGPFYVIPMMEPQREASDNGVPIRRISEARFVMSVQTSAAPPMGVSIKFKHIPRTSAVFTDTDGGTRCFAIVGTSPLSDARTTYQCLTARGVQAHEDKAISVVSSTTTPT